MKRRNVLGWLGIAPVAAVAGKAEAKAPEPVIEKIDETAARYSTWARYSGYDSLDANRETFMGVPMREIYANLDKNNAILQALKARKRIDV